MRNKALSLAKKYRSTSNALAAYKRQNLWVGRAVEVTCRYKGPGIISDDKQCPLDYVAVRLKNENVWWYPIENVKPATQAKGLMAKKGVK